MWFRLKDLYSTNTLFGSSDFSNDIIQGMASNCYLMSAIHGIAENDQRFQKIFINKDQVAAGMYALNVFVRGKPSIITVDDQIPTNYGTPLFAGVGQDGSLWGPVLEKVFTKMAGNYERTNLG